MPKLTFGRHQDVIRRNGLLEIDRLRQLDLGGLAEAVTFMADFESCLRGPRDDLERSVDAFFAKYNNILG